VNIYLNCIIESLKQKMKCYKENSDAYMELQNMVDLLEQGLMFNAKYERQI